jgi:hypothetical protein
MAGERKATFVFEQPNGGRRLADHTRHLASQGREEHGHCPGTTKTFGCPPENQARSRCRGAQAVLPVFVHPGWLDHGWSPLGASSSWRALCSQVSPLPTRWHARVKLLLNGRRDRGDHLRCLLKGVVSIHDSVPVGDPHEIGIVDPKVALLHPGKPRRARANRAPPMDWRSGTTFRAEG